jgi:GNAT superfamily N-acetyltransferase
MCNLAYGEDLASLFSELGPTVHSIGSINGLPVSHAMWVRHDLEPAGSRVLVTAYVEGVATLPECQHRGYATRVLHHLVQHLPSHIELAALSPARPELYQRSGWEFWRGPLRVRMPAGEIQYTPDERIMIMALPGTPPLDLDQPITACWRPGEVW